jgi:hypothetical protein
MKNILAVLLFSLLILLVFCDNSCHLPKEIVQDYPEHFTIQVINEIDFPRKDAIIVISIDKLQSKYPDFNPEACVMFEGKNELPSQVVDKNGDGELDELICVTDFTSNETKKLIVCYAVEGEKSRSYSKRTQAELSHKFGGKFQKKPEKRFEYVGGEFKNVEYLRVPPQHSDHSFFIRYEGPGWESDKVGYRFYLDWRNAIDIFGKKNPDMVLQLIGLDGFESYHEMSDWGMDILKVGDALGIGGIGMWYQDKVNRVSVTDSVICQILTNGPIYSQILTSYYGWQVGENKYDLYSNLSISAGSRMTECTVTITGDPPNLCTGIVKHDNVTVLSDLNSEHTWQYLATYGDQNLANDKLGMAVIFQKENLLRLDEDEYNYVVVLKPDNKKELIYYFLAAWEQEPDGIKSESEFRNELDRIVWELEKPIKVSL